MTALRQAAFGLPKKSQLFKLWEAIHNLKNWLFVGHPDAGDRPAVLYSVLGTCKLLGVDPWAYLNWALPGLASASSLTQVLFTPDKFPGLKT